ncbi:MAG TPA: hypothetical protein VG889_17140 [Rhizomicrobium sp.]|nr:hypothetical protein [Rhizomicrobium sp.]
MALVDTSVLLDILSNDPTWANWSQAAFENAAKTSRMPINDVIYADLFPGRRAHRSLRHRP